VLSDLLQTGSISKMPTDGTTFISPLGLAFTLLMGTVLLFVPRRYALVPIIILTCYMTMGERVMIGPFNFTMIRILLLFGWLRLVMHGEIHALQLNSIDKVIFWWVVSSMIMHTLLWQSSQEFINRLGGAYSIFGTYFLFRYLLTDIDDIVRAFRIVAFFLAPLAALMLLEKQTGHNLFAVFGGVPETTYVRDGVLRCQGSFGHPILAGTFGATSLPLCVALWWQGRSGKFLAAIGIVSCAIIAVASGSSGPLLAGVAGIVGLLMFNARQHLSTVRRCMGVALIALHLVMKAPVWFLLARIDIFSGSTGYHRALLIDRAVANLGGWWLFGTKSTASWASEDDHLFDVTNAYIAEGRDGGLLTMALFIAIIVLGFRWIGKAVQAMPEDRRTQLLLWSVGSSLLAHTITFFSVSYFDQNVVVWYLLLAVISTATALARSANDTRLTVAPAVELEPVPSSGFEL
jgi:hypothetical protein